jgi:hypothetical protein
MDDAAMMAGELGLDLNFEMHHQIELGAINWGSEEEQELERILGSMVDISATSLNTPTEFPSALELGQDDWGMMSHNHISVF